MSSEDYPAYSPDICPLYGGPNHCGKADGKSSCWCFNTSIPQEVLARVPDAARGVTCICEACAKNKRSPTSNQKEINKILGSR
ncbi:MAG: cysteine-rich CWC family protein [Deltaproteobacteria bacterium]|nr:cysteine-rich CWC family protein [Deltaproteobacteria bacterium]